MALIHAVVARDAEILCEHSTQSSNTSSFSQTIQTLLSKIPPNDSKLTYSANEYQFHYIKSGNLVVLVMAQDEAGRRMPFGFLAELQRQFLARYNHEDINNAPANGMKDFTPTMSDLMTKFPDSSRDPAQTAKAEMAQVKDILVDNIERVLERGERIDLLVDRTDNMSANARAFRKRSQSLRRRMWWKNIRLIGLTVFVVILLLYLLLASACGASLSSCH